MYHFVLDMSSKKSISAIYTHFYGNVQSNRRLVIARDPKTKPFFVFNIAGYLFHTTLYFSGPFFDQLAK